MMFLAGVLAGLWVGCGIGILVMCLIQIHRDR